MRHLHDERIAELVAPPDAERAVADAFAAWGRGDAATTPRVRAAAGAAMASAMAAVVPPYCGGKVYATASGRFTFVVVLFRASGTLLATLDGDVLTQLRTPAASSLAIRHLAAPAATTATVIGAGRQAWGHVEMLRRALPHLRELRICGHAGGRGPEPLTARARAAGIPATSVDGAAAAVDGAQVIITLSTSRDPLFPASAVADDALICAVGATKADRVEIGADVVERCATVVCDDVVGARTECGDLVQAAAAGRFEWSRAVELHAVAAGRIAPARAGGAPVLFETQGVAVQDVAVAALAYDRDVAARTARGPNGPRPDPEPVPLVPTEETR